MFHTIYSPTRSKHHSQTIFCLTISETAKHMNQVQHPKLAVHKMEHSPALQAQLYHFTQNHQMYALQQKGI